MDSQDLESILVYPSVMKLSTFLIRVIPRLTGYDPILKVSLLVLGINVIPS